MACLSPFQNTDCMCGEFTDPDPALPGQCTPLRVKRDCEAPVVPTLSTVSYDPDESPPFQVI